MGRLVGREIERARLAGLLDAARAGLSGVLVVHGPAGIGKTSLLDEAVAAAPDVDVLRVDGVESEATLGFAALHRLLVPVLDRRDRLPPRQRAALDATFGLGEAPPADRFVVGLAVLTLLAEAATDRPLLCVVDDAQWIDRESLEVVSFVGRRLHADRVVLLLAVRDPEDGPPAVPDGLAALPVGALDAVAARQLLTEVATVPLDADVADRIVQVTEGRPLAIVELVGELSGEQLTGAGLLPEPLPLGARLEGHFLARVRELPAATQTLLVLLAADPSGDPTVLWAAAGRLGIDPVAAEPAEAAGLVTSAPGIGFRHPLIRSAVYGGAQGGPRRRVHQALADATDRAADPDRWARHRAAAAVGLDEDLAVELERCADRARDRGGYAADAAYRSLAADMTPDPRRRARRIVLEGEVADAAHPPSGCYFHPRCRYAEDICRTERPRLEEMEPGHQVRCHRARELTLRGVDDGRAG